MKRQFLVGVVILILLLAGCGTQVTNQEKEVVVSSKTSETEDVNETDSSEKEDGSIEEVNNTESMEADEKASEIAEEVIEVVDINEYILEWTKQYGGTLEEQLAERLGTEAVYHEDGSDDWMTLCDEKIEIYNSVNNTDYFLNYFERVPEFEIYGIYPGMKKEEAISTLEGQGMISDEYGNYATEFEVFYIFFEVDEDDTLSKVCYVRRTEADSASDYDSRYIN